DIGSLAPAITQYSSGQEVGTPSVRTGLIEDLYLSLSSPPDDDGQIGLRARVNPMMLWLWIGLGVMGLGTAFAGWPTRRRKPTTSQVESHVTSDVEASDVSTTAPVPTPEGVL
ncbi:MAG: cytochrome c-type biogenesis CcmF C-terminal domain-containing protein, partial [Ilumatobacter sp.]